MFKGFLLGIPLIAAISFAATAEETTKWYDKIKLGGDLRFRHDYMKKSPGTGSAATDEYERHRERIRLRLSAVGKVNDEVTFKARLSGGDDGSPISANTTMTDNASKKSFYIDMAAIDWKMYENTNAVVGKQENPLRILSKSELIYDSDYNPEGLSLSYNNDLIFRAAGFSLKERKPDSTNGTNEPDSWLLAGLLAYKSELGENLELTAGGGYHAFTAFKKNETLGLSNKFDGNSSVGAGAAGRYIHDYQVGEIFLELRTKIGERGSLSAYVDAIQNFIVEEDNTGLLAGVQYQTLNDDGKPVSTFGYTYQTTGKDATVSALNNSDLNDGVEGGIGHIFTAGRNIMENTRLSLTYWHGEIDNSGAQVVIDRAAVDLAVNF